MQLNIFIDLHHESLYKSVQMLFEDRLGYRLFRPIGEEWFEKGFWKNAEIYANHPDTIAQFLQIRDAKPTKMKPRNTVKTVKEDRGDYYIINSEYKDEKAVTFEQFCDMDIDIVIASYYGNVEPYSRLVKEYKPNAKFIMQMGNNWPVPWEIVNNLMASVGPKQVNVPTGKNVVFYHQEFNQELYKWREPNTDSKYVRSFVHCMMEHVMHARDWADFLALEKALPEFTWESYGISCRDGKVLTQRDIGIKMSESKFGIHLKNHGDGFGHVLFNWFASGRPVIVRKSQYKDKLGEALMIDGVNCIDLDSCANMATAATKIKEAAEPDRYLAMCKAAQKKFKEVVDYDADEKKIREFLGRLI